ncbi:MAG: S-layer homology domain-containing protein [Oscillospiraceae bacterium]|nr:S-layer homology domain-containing protein [Oscillospiraceae bacterium]
MRLFHRLAAALLTIALTASCLAPVGAFAATSTTKAVGFRDITDTETAVNAETLRIMGVLGGFEDGTFRPNSTLTRAQFCKMAVVLMGNADLVGQYKNYTIFPDVKASNWAAGYVNLAVRGTTKIIAGYADGTFGPNKNITYGEAVTILMRILGYADSDVGAVWPDGYLAAAAEKGLTSELSLSGSAALTRAQAAKLFVRTLDADKKGGGMYGASVATSAITDVVLMSSSATAADGTDGAMKTSDGDVYKLANTTSSTGVLNGRKGTLLLDKNEKVITFVPTDSGTCKAISVAIAKSSYLTDSTGTKYSVGAKIPAYYNGEKKTYGDVFSWLTAGTSATVYINGGAVEYIFVGSQSFSKAIVVGTDKSTDGFSELAGGQTYSIYKDGAEASVADIKKYDVATYDGSTGSIRLCDNRLTGVYEDCYPDTSAPVKVSMFGTEFSVLSSTTSNLSGFSIGSSVTFLLTEDNQVAGIVSSGTVSNTAVGIVQSVSRTSASVHLLNGLTVSGNPQLSSDTDVTDLTGQLVKVVSTGAGKIAITKLTGGNSQNFDVANKKVGTSALADNAIIYEKVGTSALTPITISDIRTSTVSSSKITYVGKNWAGDVNILVLDNVTGDAYTYGRATVTETEETDTFGSYMVRSISVTNGNGTKGPFSAQYGISDGDYVGLAVSADGSSIGSYITLTRALSVPNSAWIGSTAVVIGGQTYKVSSDVQCYNRTGGKWITLDKAHAFAESSTLYYDSLGVVRVVVVA